jgi:hypothetical protein
LLLRKRFLIDLFATLLWFLLQNSACVCTALGLPARLRLPNPADARSDEDQNGKLLWKRTIGATELQKPKIVRMARAPAVCLLHP